jgi:hypothetical protein
MNKDVLIGFWHGVGDHIIASPAIKRFRELNPDIRIGWAATNRYVKSGIFKYCPYINEIFETHDVWEDPKLGITALNGDRNTAKHYHLVKLVEIANQNNYKKILQINLDNVTSYPPVHRIDNIFSDFGIEKVNYNFEIWTSKEDEQEVKQFLIDKELLDKKFVFVHATSTCEGRNWNKELVNSFLKRKYGDTPLIFSDSPEIMKMNVRSAFLVMKHASNLVLNNSSYLQAADAFKKDVDYAFYECAKWALGTFRPLNIKCNLINPNITDINTI